MSASPKFESPLTHKGVAKVIVIDGRQAILLPENVHVSATELDILQHSTDIFMRPASKQLSPEDIAQWLAEVHPSQQQPGDFMLDQRNQPPA